MSHISPRIYVACLASYNNGCLHGRWIDAAQELDDLSAEVQAMLDDSPEDGAEEFAIHDYEGFGDLALHEFESLSVVARVAALVSEHGELFGAVAAYVGDITEAEDAMRERYQGAWDNLEAWAEDYLEQAGEINQIPEHLRPYFDFAAYARDFDLNGDVFTVNVDGATHVFWAH